MTGGYSGLKFEIDHFTVVDGREAEGDLVLTHDTNLLALLCKSSYSYAN